MSTLVVDYRQHKPARCPYDGDVAVADPQDVRTTQFRVADNPTWNPLAVFNPETGEPYEYVEVTYFAWHCRPGFHSGPALADLPAFVSDRLIADPAGPNAMPHGPKGGG